MHFLTFHSEINVEISVETNTALLLDAFKRLLIVGIGY